MKSLSRARLLATPWTAAYQAPPSMGFSRQEYWSGVPLPSPRHWQRRGLIPLSWTVHWIPSLTCLAGISNSVSKTEVLILPLLQICSAFSVLRLSWWQGHPSLFSFESSLTLFLHLVNPCDTRYHHLLPGLLQMPSYWPPHFSLALLWSRVSSHGDFIKNKSDHVNTLLGIPNVPLFLLELNPKS